MMKQTFFPIVTGLAIVATAACGNNTARSTNNNTPNSTASNVPAADQRAENAAEPITVTGCLQQDGRTFIVTRQNDPSHEGIGTTGSGDTVEREQLDKAANAYRVESKDQSDWNSMVGKQVRVSGSVDKTAHLPAASASDEPSGTSGMVTRDGDAVGADAKRHEKIDKGDLAQLNVESMSVVSDNCGGKATSKKPAKNRSTTSEKQR
jgi:hypothetical protein